MSSTKENCFPRETSRWFQPPLIKFLNTTDVLLQRGGRLQT